MNHPFSDQELLDLLEIARYALSDADVFDDMSVTLDIADKEMVALRDKLTKFMEVR